MITSDINDKKLKESNCYYVGYGSVRTVFFRTLDSKFLVLTLADIGSSYLKKSMFNVHYFYIFHSLISSHVAYKEHAFDNYIFVNPFLPYIVFLHLCRLFSI